MDYGQTLDYLYAQLPMFHRIGAAAYKADLKNTLAICELLQHPENKFRSIHIAGTNGKGSTSHMLAAILQSAGYKTGLYTSPHLKDFRERIRINGEMIPQETVTAFVERHRADFDKIQPSFFEWTVGLAFDYFAKEQVDIAVIETGLGGRLDSTNVITPLLSVITNIGRDHMNLLGDTVEKIAEEKAGIIKEEVPVVIGQTQEDVMEVFLEKAEEMNAPIVFADQNFSAEVEPSGTHLQVKVSSHRDSGLHYFALDQRGFYQVHNLVTVLQAVEELANGGWNIPKHAVEEGLKNVNRLTGLQGRWQELSKSPPTFCDVGHNEDGIREVMDCIGRTPHHKLLMVVGAVSDKAIDNMLDRLPSHASYFFCKADTPRSMDAGELRQKAEGYGLKGEVFKSVKEALAAAQLQADENDLVVVTGSSFVVAEVV